MSEDKEILELETRKSIYEAVRKYPGLHLRELARQLDMSVPLVDYHLSFLERHGLVTGIMDAQFKRYYPRDPLGAKSKTDTLSSEQKRIVALLRQRIPLQIVLYLLNKGNARHKEMVPLMGISPSTLTHHLNKLLRRNVIEKVGDEGFRLVDAAGIARLLMTYSPPPGTLSESFAKLWDEFRS
ncbi:MAG: ArsR family transcriptional regulator [Methanomassiliicoccales archaeon]